MLEVGTKAPAFTLPDKDGNPVSLSDFAGKKVVLYFYPKDNTPGCTRQACAFAAAYADFKTMDVAVIGVSKDSTASHQRFAEKHGLPFLLLSRPGADRDSGLWRLAGEKAVRQGEHGRGAHDLYHRRAGDD